MKPRPFYRSRLFWLGLPGLVFLLWAWWVSMGSYLYAGFEGIHGLAVRQMGGELCLTWDSDGWPDWRHFTTSHGRWSGGAGEVAAAKLMFTMMRENDPTSRFVFIPYYWLVFAYIAGWLLTLALWQRRKSRILKLHTAS